MKQQKARRLIGCLVVTVGLLGLNYPFLAGVVNDLFAYRELQGYQTELQNTDDEELTQTLETARAYNEALSSGGSLTEFEDFPLLQTDALLGYVELPQIGVYMAVRYGTENEVLKQCCGLVADTSLPVGGESTHAVISGHTGMASKKMLTDLTQMQTGDIFFLHSLGQDMAYQVDQIIVVEPWDVDELGIVKGEDYVTLLTCTPYGVNDHRLLVRGSRIGYDFSSGLTGQQGSVMRYSTVERLRMAIAAVSGLCFVGMIIALLRSGKQKRQDRSI
ncbi:MAG: class C sortase [Oscillospiraceae bacterium]|nr:class C sortase [Oscillospiraceae bacterium]